MDRVLNWDYYIDLSSRFEAIAMMFLVTIDIAVTAFAALLYIGTGRAVESKKAVAGH